MTNEQDAKPEEHLNLSLGDGGLVQVPTLIAGAPLDAYSLEDHPQWLSCKDGDGDWTSLRGDLFAASLRHLIESTK